MTTSASPTISTTTATATPSTNTLPCDTCTAHTPSFAFIVVALLVIAVFICLAVYSKGEESGREQMVRAMLGKHKGRR